MVFVVYEGISEIDRLAQFPLIGQTHPDPCLQKADTRS